jgi:hypothetical protein
VAVFNEDFSGRCGEFEVAIFVVFEVDGLVGRGFDGDSGVCVVMLQCVQKQSQHDHDETLH